MIRRIFSKLNGGKLFTKLYLSDACLQIQVEDVCSKLLMINTHKDFKFTQLPFSIKVVLAIFQQAISTMLAEYDFMMAYLDDISIKSESHNQQVKHIKCVKKYKELQFHIK